VRWLLVTPILVTLMMEALSSSETLVLTRATRRNIPEDAILHADGVIIKPLNDTLSTRYQMRKQDDHEW
jgi:hypothetical protein